MIEAFAELESGVQAALETYSNVHRGSGHNSLVSTHLYEQAREIVLEYLDLDPDRYVVIFCTSRRTDLLKKVSENSQPSFLTDRCKHKIRSIALLENPAFPVSW